MRRSDFDGDPMDLLRRADPLHPGDVPSDTTGAHARALFEEVIHMEKEQSTTVKERPKRLRPVAALSGVAIVAMVAVVAILMTRNDAGDEVIVGGEPIASAAMCVETYDLDTLANREVAFDGTLAAVDGDSVTFTVNHWYKGGAGDETTLTATGLTGVTSVGGPSLQVGQRYLVSGSGGFVWACGFTMTYDTAIAGQWADVFDA